MKLPTILVYSRPLGKTIDTDNSGKPEKSFAMNYLLIPLIVFCFAAISLACLFPAHARTGSKVLVMLDPGHGGEDEGTNHLKIKEKDLSLKVSLEIKKALLKDPMFDVILTR